MVKWSDPPDKDSVLVQAESCSKNCHVHNKDGTEQPSPHNIYVNDNLMADIMHMIPHTLLTAVEAISVVVGLPKLVLRP